MRNPWQDLRTDRPPFVLDDDDAVLRRRYPHVRDTLALNMLPTPFMGPIDAPVVLLSLNPSGKTDDFALGLNGVDERRRAMCFADDAVGWWLSRTWEASGGYRYWQKRLQALRE